MSEILNFNKWVVEYSADDGGRIDRISYRGFDLLTKRPTNFRPPESKHGLYEDRPVYGYDDCFPSVVACRYPKSNVNIPDHGELCYLKWKVIKSTSHLIFSVRSKILPLIFVRKIDFCDDYLLWNFEVINEGTEIFPFQHVMHPLVPISQLSSIELPDFQAAYDWEEKTHVVLKGKNDICEFFMNRPSRSHSMLFFQNVSEGRIRWTYKNGTGITASFPVEIFPTIGVWWNNLGYPDEDNLRRDECSFEPVPGPTSDLFQAYSSNSCLFVHPGKSFKWQIKWEIS